jgi:hypothetical protein
VEKIKTATVSLPFFFFLFLLPKKKGYNPFEDRPKVLSTELVRKVSEVENLQDSLTLTRQNYFVRIRACEEREKELEEKVKS